MDNMTQQNSSLAEETATASEGMANMANELLFLIRQFKIDDGSWESLADKDAAEAAENAGNGKAEDAQAKAEEGSAVGQLHDEEKDHQKALISEGYEQF